MTSQNKFLVPLLACLAACGGQPRLQLPNNFAGGIAIVGADVLPMTSMERLADQTVLVAGDRITRVAPRHDVTIPPGYRIIDGRGSYLMPGLVDMHVHLAPESGKQGDAAHRALAVMLAHGVTTARGMAGSPNNLIVRAAIEHGHLAGPRLYAAAPGLNDKNSADEEAVRSAVRNAKDAGYDLVKSHHLSALPVWQAVQEEARLQGLAVAGHVTNQVGVDRALAARQQIEHLDGVLLELLPAGAPERQIDFAQIPPPAVIMAAASSSDAALQGVAQKVARSGGYQVPTLALFEKVVALDTPAEALLSRPEMRFVPDQALKQWSAQREQLRAAGLTAEHGRALRDIRRRIVRAFADAGVPIMAGSDTAQAFHVWGRGLLDELAALVEAGLSPMDALRTATVVPRTYFASLPNGGSALGWKPDFGIVEAGARADLILLRDDPSVAISALRSLETVIAGGNIYDRVTLDAMLDQAATDANGQQVGAGSGKPARRVFVMRHLQTGIEPDPGLTQAGAEGALRLADLLANSELRAIYVTDTRRSRDTAAPLAARLGLTPVIYDPRRPDRLANQVQETAGNVLVIGHSNTVPDLVARMGGKPPAALSHTDFGTIWQIESGSGATRAVDLACHPPLSRRSRHGGKRYSAKAGRSGLLAVRQFASKLTPFAAGVKPHRVPRVAVTERA